tara:strand:- start:156 stop:827 length:672 start_codon:yes stop_codon:yes gene_type:complete
MPTAITCVYYIEVLSSWCHWAEPAWVELRERYASRVDFQWRVALMRPEAFPVSASQCDWFYQRSGAHVESPYRLNSGWFEADRAGHYEAPNWVAEAGRDFLGDADERIRLALSEAAMRDGRKVGDLATSVEIAATATDLDPVKLRTAADSDAVGERVAASTQRFFDHQLDQRPSFIIESEIGDKAVFSGLWKSDPLMAILDSMLDDHARQTAHAKQFGRPPTV